MHPEFYFYKGVLLDHQRAFDDEPDFITFVDRAYRFANEKHAAHIRASGEPYITHLIEVAYILASFQTSPQVVAAGFLHDTVEDCGVKKEELAVLFGQDVADLVEAVTKVGQLSSRTKEQLEAENHRKIFIAMAKDVRVILIKLADRLHNMRTLFAKSPEKQRRIAAETLNVYAPIAHRLGINTIKSELEDISLSYLEPEKYNYIMNLLSSQEAQREENLHRMIKRIEAMLYEHKIPFKMYGRVKNIYSIYKKMYVKERRFEEIYDLHALRIITETNVECYEILGYIHEMFRPIPGRFKDYIDREVPQDYDKIIYFYAGDVFGKNPKDLLAKDLFGNPTKDIDLTAYAEEIISDKRMSNMLNAIVVSCQKYQTLIIGKQPKHYICVRSEIAHRVKHLVKEKFNKTLFIMNL